MIVLADSCWYIDVQRGAPVAHDYARRNPLTQVVLCEIVRAELLAADAPPVDVAARTVLGVDEAVARHWATARRTLRRQGQTIGTNDLWIAATALAHALHVLTRDAAFERVPDLRVLRYDVE